MKRFMAFATLVILGYKAPDIFLTNQAKKRTDAIRKGLPDALDLLVICAEAGLTVDAAFNRVAKELGRAYPELGDEFALTAIELSFLTERRQASPRSSSTLHARLTATLSITVRAASSRWVAAPASPSTAMIRHSGMRRSN